MWNSRRQTQATNCTYRSKKSFGKTRQRLSKLRLEGARISRDVFDGAAVVFRALSSNRDTQLDESRLITLLQIQGHGDVGFEPQGQRRQQ